MEVFHEGEKQGFTDRLTLLFYIMKGIIGLNCQRIIEYLLSDPVYLDTFGVLEYDPDINISKSKYRYRTFLQERVSFVNTANIQDPDVLEKIHLNFRLIFMRDTAAARWIDESSYELLMTVRFLCLSPPIDDKYELRGNTPVYIRERVQSGGDHARPKPVTH